MPYNPLQKKTYHPSGFVSVTTWDLGPIVGTSFRDLLFFGSTLDDDIFYYTYAYGTICNDTYSANSGITNYSTPSGHAPFRSFFTASGSNRNKDWVKQSRLQMCRRYKLALVDTPFAVKTRKWDFKADKWKTVRSPGKAWRLVEIRPKPRAPVGGWLSNSLSSDSYSWISLDSNNTKYLLRKMVIPIGGFNHGLIQMIQLYGDSAIADTGWLWGLPYIPFTGTVDHDYYRFNQTISDIQESDPVSMSFYSSYVDSANDIAIGRLYKKIKNQKLDLATDLAEMAQTVGMISTAAVKLGEAFLLLKGGKVLKALSVLLPSNKKEASGMFLAYRYGVAPLVSDIDGAAQHLAESLNGVRPTYVHSKSKTLVPTQSAVLFDSDFVSVSETVDTEIIVKYNFTFNLDKTWINELSRLGFTSPVNVAWELTPFSFVIDWLLPIGNFFGNLSALDGLVFKENTRTLIINEKRTLRVTFKTFGGFVAHNNSGFTNYLEYKMVRRRIERTVNTNASLFPDLPYPKFKNPFSTGHVANAIALLTQMLSGKQ